MVTASEAVAAVRQLQACAVLLSCLPPDGKARELFSHALSEVHLAQGDLAGARAYLDKALAYYQPNHLTPYLTRALATQATLADSHGSSTSTR